MKNKFNRKSYGLLQAETIESNGSVVCFLWKLMVSLRNGGARHSDETRTDIVLYSDARKVGVGMASSIPVGGYSWFYE